MVFEFKFKYATESELSIDENAEHLTNAVLIDGIEILDSLEGIYLVYKFNEEAREFEVEIRPQDIDYLEDQLIDLEKLKERALLFANELDDFIPMDESMRLIAGDAWRIEKVNKSFNPVEISMATADEFIHKLRGYK